jgi:hypothetical protein
MSFEMRRHLSMMSISPDAMRANALPASAKQLVADDLRRLHPRFRGQAQRALGSSP